jgi:hypothetical protein
MIIDNNDDDERKFFKIDNYQDSSFQKISSQIVFFFNVFDFSKIFFQNIVRRGERGRARWCRNMKVQSKISKHEFFTLLPPGHRGKNVKEGGLLSCRQAIASKGERGGSLLDGGDLGLDNFFNNA